MRTPGERYWRKRIAKEIARAHASYTGNDEHTREEVNCEVCQVWYMARDVAATGRPIW